MKRISNFVDFKSDAFDVSYVLDESEGRGLSTFEQVCLEEGIQFSDSEELNEEYFYEAADEIESINEGKFGKFLKKIGNKALGFVKNNFGTIVKTLGLSLAGPLGPLAGLLTKGLGGLIGKLNLKPGEKMDRSQLSSAAAENPEIKKISDVHSKTLQKLMDSVKKDPSSFMTGDTLTSLRNLVAISTAANQTLNQVSKEAKSTPVAAPAAAPAAPAPAAPKAGTV
jgi:hypothetical protein